MEKENLFNDEFLKQFKTVEELNDFLKQNHKRGIEKMLEGELDGHLGYSKSQKSNNTNSRNGHSEKKVRTSFGESDIQVPRDRDASFNPMIVPKRGNTMQHYDNKGNSGFMTATLTNGVWTFIGDTLRFTGGF